MALETLEISILISEHVLMFFVHLRLAMGSRVAKGAFGISCRAFTRCTEPRNSCVAVCAFELRVRSARNLETEVVRGKTCWTPTRGRMALLARCRELKRDMIYRA